ncbi:hypothetical protein V6N13_042386 [Hibiscus sabdariffa]
MSELKLFGKLIPLLTLNQGEACCDRNLLSSSVSLDAVNSNHRIQAQPPMQEHQFQTIISGFSFNESAIDDVVFKHVNPVDISEDYAAGI